MTAPRNAYGRIPKRTRKRIGTPPTPMMTIFGHTSRVMSWDAPARATPCADIRAMLLRVRAVSSGASKERR